MTTDTKELPKFVRGKPLTWIILCTIMVAAILYQINWILYPMVIFNFAITFLAFLVLGAIKERMRCQASMPTPIRVGFDVLYVYLLLNGGYTVLAVLHTFQAAMEVIIMHELKPARRHV